MKYDFVALALFLVMAFFSKDLKSPDTVCTSVKQRNLADEVYLVVGFPRYLSVLRIYTELSSDIVLLNYKMLSFPWLFDITSMTVSLPLTLSLMKEELFIYLINSF